MKNTFIVALIFFGATSVSGYQRDCSDTTACPRGTTIGGCEWENLFQDPPQPTFLTCMVLDTLLSDAISNPQCMPAACIDAGGKTLVSDLKYCTE